MTLSVETKDYKLYEKLYDELTGFYGEHVDEIINDYLKKKIKNHNKKNPLFKKKPIEERGAVSSFFPRLT
jgi:hypothetical protein